MSKYTHFTKLKHLIFLNGGSTTSKDTPFLRTEAESVSESEEDFAVIIMQV
jgi:hypothetical protein